jgi:hypothetical protein
MQATIDSAILQEALRVALRLSPPISGNVTLASDGAKLFLHSAGELSRCSILLPCEVKGKSFFAIGTEALRDATKGHQELSMVYDKTMLNIKSGRYSASLTTVDAIAMEEEKEEKGDSWKLTVEQAQWLKSAVQQVALKPTANITAFMPVSVKLSDKGAFVACYDNQHMAFINDKEIKGELDVTLPIETLNAVLDTFNKTAFKMTVTPAALLVKNKIVDVTLSLPATEDDAQIGTDAVIGKAREALKADGKQIEVAKTDVTAFLDNARAVATKERSEILVSTDAGKLNLVVKTTNGTSKSTIKAGVKTKQNFAVDYDFFSEAISKCSESVVFKVVENAFLTFQLKNAHILVALNQSE